MLTAAARLNLYRVSFEKYLNPDLARSRLVCAIDCGVWRAIRCIRTAIDRRLFAFFALHAARCAQHPVLCVLAGQCPAWIFAPSGLCL
jgi:hypothetical protein